MPATRNTTSFSAAAKENSRADDSLCVLGKMEEKLLGQIGFLVTEFSSAIVSSTSSSPSVDKCLITDERKQLTIRDILE